MPHEIKAIHLSLPYHLGSVNCYLIKTNTGYILIDTGSSNQRAGLEKELENAGCQPGNLNLIVITHGDSDHSGNAAYLRVKYGAKIALHRGESEAVELGNMILSRRNKPLLTRVILPLFKLSARDRFKPDHYLEDGDDLSEYGFEAKVLHLPGHSKGSIGILATGRDSSIALRQAQGGSSGQVLFCGDLLNNTNKPVINSLMDDPAVAKASLERLKRFAINIVYPGHGNSFPMELLAKNQ